MTYEVFTSDAAGSRLLPHRTWRRSSSTVSGTMIGPVLTAVPHGPEGVASAPPQRGENQGADS